MFTSSVLLALCLTSPAAQAAAAGPILLIIGSNDILFRVTTPTEVYGVTAEVASDAGSEAVTLTESDTSLHGSATLAALPSVDARITLTLYDTASASLMSFSGTLGADGSVSVKANAPECEEGSREVCSTTNPDIELLAADVFLGSAGGFDVAFDLEGADAYDVAYADIVVIESSKVTVCEKDGACTTTGSTTTTEAEVAWDSLSAVWEGSLTLAHEGAIEVKAKTLDSAGKKIETVKAQLSAPWIDGAGGTSALVSDDDPLTSLSFSKWDEPMEVPFAELVSEGWSTSTAPVSAVVELTNGATLTIKANSYQRTMPKAETTTLGDISALASLRISINGGAFSLNGAAELSVDDLASPLCADGYCVLLQEDADGEGVIGWTSYASTAAELPDYADVVVTLLDKEGFELDSVSETVGFGDDVAVIFAAELEISADPLGEDLSGKVSLLGAPDKNGKQPTLAKGKFYGTFSRDTDGDVALTGADKGSVSPSGTLITGGTSVALSDADNDGYVDGPPVVAALPATGGPTTSGKHGEILIDGVSIDYE